MKEPKFFLDGVDGRARIGRYATSHGVFDTPNFMPVGTRASVKGVDVERLRECGCQITLVNTYHLWLRPGPQTVAQLGGIHRFCSFDGPILSDSGGYQVFSLRGTRSIREEGVEFRSHLDGSKHFLSPERSIEIQEQLGVDIAMVLDECPSMELEYSEVAKSLAMTQRWALRSKAAQTRDEMAMFAITQGGKHRDLRTSSAEWMHHHQFNGYAIGGLSVGEPKEVMYEVLSYHPEQLPHASIRYLMGVGTPRDIVEAVSCGVDLFDCVMPTRAGRFGRAFLSVGLEPFINIKNAIHALDGAPLDSQCRCVACRNYSRAYLHHLFKVGEMLGPQLLTIHNLTYYLSLMGEIRRAVAAGSFIRLYQQIDQQWSGVETV